MQFQTPNSPIASPNMHFNADKDTAGSGANNSGHTDTNSAQFTGAQLAAMRFTELLAAHPAIKEIITALAVDPEKLNKVLEDRAKGLDESVQQQKEFLKQLGNLRPDQVAKDTFTEFVAKAFTHTQIEYMISLVNGVVNDPRLGEIVKAVPKAIDTFGEVLVSGAQRFASKVEEIFSKSNK